MPPRNLGFSFNRPKALTFSVRSSNMVQLISSKEPTQHELLMELDERFVGGSPANDTCEVQADAPYLRDLNELVSHLTTNVVRAAGNSGLRVDLSLNPSIHDHVAAPDLVSFVVGGVLTTQLQSCTESEQGHLMVSTEIEGNDTVVTVLANNVPPLDAIRAIADKLGIARANGADSVLLHCREIVEALGGSIQLRDDLVQRTSFLGFELRIPTVPRAMGAVQGHPVALIRTSSEPELLMTGS